MKIAIDCSKAVNEKAGIARYTWEIAANLPKYFKRDEFLYFFNFLRGKAQKEILIKKILGENKNIQSKIYKLPGGLKERLFPSYFSLLNIWLKGCDIYHATEFLSFDKNLKIPQVLTVHDLALVRFPLHRGRAESSRHVKMLKSACANSNAIISDSKSTKNDIVKYFNVSSKKIKVIYPGYNKIFKKVAKNHDTERIFKRYNINKPFILFVGTIEPRKNIVNPVKAFELFSKKDANNYSLYIVGKKGWNTSEIEKVHQASLIKNKIKFLNYVPDHELLHLYNNCSLFCYPSIFEGFGFPPLEAMACGAPVLTSKISSIPEVCGSAAYYIEPDDYRSIYSGMHKILNDRNIANKMSADGIKRAKNFSWEKCVKKTHEIYNEVLKK